MVNRMLRPVSCLILAAGLLGSGCGKAVSVAIPDTTYGNGSTSYPPVQNLPTGTVTGRVIDATTGLGIPDVEVDVQGISPPVNAQTDGAGNYTLTGVPALRTKLVLQKTGFTYLQGAGDVIVEVLPGNTITVPDIKLLAQLQAVPNAFVLSISNLDHPRFLTINDSSSASDSALYVINRENYQLFGNIQTPLLVWGVRKFNLAGGLENKFGGALLINDLQNPQGIAVDKGGDVYVTDPGNNLVRTYSAFGSLIKPADGASYFTGISQPYDIKVLRTGQFVVSSSGNDQVMLFDASMGTAHDAAGEPIKPISGSTGLKGLTVDANDSIYFVDDAAPAGGVIKKVSTAGEVLLQFGFRGGRGSGYFEQPTDIAVDNRNGDIYVVDSGNNRIQRFNRDGSFMSEFGGMGAGNGQFNNPSGITVDKDGYVFVSDTNNNRIEKFAPSAIITPGT